MSERKNIDHFFQEQLEHFEVTPPEMAWENIEAKLNEKEKKRRVIPFWWKLSGVAAILLLGFMLLAPYFNSNPKQNNPIVNQENSVSTGQKQTDVISNEMTKTTNNKTVLEEQKSAISSVSTEDKTSGSSIKSNNTTSLSNKNNEQKVASVSTTNKKKQTASKETIPSNKLVSDDAVASNLKGQKASNKKQNSAIDKITTSQDTQPNTTINQNIGQTNSGEPNKNVAVTTVLKDKNTITTIENKEKIVEEIKKIDSTKLAAVEPNALEELLIEKEKKIAKERKENRWQVTPNIAPIYFSSISSGSPLDEKLTENEKVYGTNYSYGLGVNYKLNKKVQIRSGINTFSADYDTRGIVFYQNTSASKMQNVTPNLQGSLIQIDPLNNVNHSFGKIIEEKFEGTLNQRMAYIEVPLEVSYKILAKKFGVDVIGGISTLFLSQNDVYLKTTGFNMKIGEASNLNDIHFSTNIGLGLKYSFLKRFDARVEPLFKYQFNTYSSGAGNFKPYVFGVYSGISYHF
ncbi:MAG: hypothetical protein V4648_02265 [Bacteroidota bacterium]